LILPRLDQAAEFSTWRPARNAVLERANGGTLLIEEISEISLDTQAKLFRVLQTGEFKRFATHQSVKTNVRIIATTGRDLAQMVTSSEFQPDFYSYLTAARIDIPPLRDRREDVPALLDHYVDLIAESLGLGPKKLSPDVVNFFATHSWPRNVTELQAVLELSLLHSSGDTVRMADLTSELGI
jgi:two-component system, NtrC family, nitrogen regulation response regulator NtrX